MDSAVSVLPAPGWGEHTFALPSSPLSTVSLSRSCWPAVPPSGLAAPGSQRRSRYREWWELLKRSVGLLFHPSRISHTDAVSARNTIPTIQIAIIHLIDVNHQSILPSDYILFYCFAWTAFTHFFKNCCLLLNLPFIQFSVPLKWEFAFLWNKVLSLSLHRLKMFYSTDATL